ncbi:hypothetical protein [Lysinibacillus sp. NPDC056185]|uniref:hypothetical protein n=1 Tax=Lysinibacillus sp. NPDC056185 TaxID=3345739 RepID=UPI0039F018F7
MENNFLSQTVRFLQKSDLKIYPIVYREYEVQINEEEVVFSGGGSILKDYFSKPHISDNLILQIIDIFSTLDAKIDIDFPNLQGKSFRYKYIHLPNSSDEEIILKECYRLFKLLRNAATHSMNSITISNDDIVAEYDFNHTNFHLKITSLGISYLFTYVLEPFNSNSLYTQNFFRAFNRELYDLLKQEVSTFSDDFGTELNSISSNLKLRRGVRNYIVNPSYEISNETSKLKITTPYIKHAIYEKDYGVDYFIKIPESNKYLIPDEVLNDQYEIKLTNLQDWKLDND